MLHFTTPHGAHYTVNAKGQIGGGPNRVRHGPGWVLVGIAVTGPGFAFGKRALSFEQLTPEAVKATQWRYKTSGNPRFTVIDRNHGTVRVWGNTRAHGIRGMWYDEEN